MDKADVRAANLALVRIFSIAFIAMICFASLLAYPSVQKSLFSKSSDLMFINNTREGIYTVAIMGLIPFFLTFFVGYIILWQNNAAFKKIITYKALLFSILLMGIGYCYQLYHYQSIDNQGIHIRKNIFNSLRDYEFSDVGNVYVYIKNGEGKQRGNLHIRYEIVLNDGTVIDLKSSSEFWERIVVVDNLLTSQGIKVSRDKIDFLIYIDMIRRYDGVYDKDIPCAVEKIFAYTPEYKW